MAEMETKTLFQLYGMEKSIQVVLSATKKLRERVRQEKSPIKLSNKAQKLKERCISFGPSGPKWAAIISDLIEENITLEDTGESYPFVKFAAIVPTCSFEGHKYQPNRVLFMLFFGGKEDCPDYIRGIRFDGTLGDNIYLKKCFCNIASDSEIIETVKAIFKGLDSDELLF